MIQASLNQLLNQAFIMQKLSPEHEIKVEKAKAEAQSKSLVESGKLKMKLALQDYKQPANQEMLLEGAEEAYGGLYGMYEANPTEETFKRAKEAKEAMKEYSSAAAKRDQAKAAAKEAMEAEQARIQEGRQIGKQMLQNAPKSIGVREKIKYDNI